MSFEILHSASTQITKFLDRTTFDPREETLTEMLLVELQDRLPRFEVKKQTTTEESKNGADFLLTVAMGDEERTFFIQAKRLYKEGRYEALPHETATTDKETQTTQISFQEDALNDAAAAENTTSKTAEPLYLFFNSPKYGVFAETRVTLSGITFAREWSWCDSTHDTCTFPQSSLGITICSFAPVAGALKGFRAKRAEARENAKKNKENEASGISERFEPTQVKDHVRQEFLAAERFLQSSIPFEHMIEPPSFVRDSDSTPQNRLRFSELFENLLQHDQATPSVEQETGDAGDIPAEQAWDLFVTPERSYIRTPDGDVLIPGFTARLELTQAAEIPEATTQVEAAQIELKRPTVRKGRGNRSGRLYTEPALSPYVSIIHSHQDKEIRELKRQIAVLKKAIQDQRRTTHGKTLNNNRDE